MDLAALAPAHDPAGDAHARPLVVGPIGRQGQDFLNRLMAVEAAAPRIEAERFDGPELVGAAGFVGNLRFRHGGTAFVLGVAVRWIKDET